MENARTPLSTLQPQQRDGRARISARDKAVKFGFPIGAILIGLCRVWAGRHAVNPDGVSYIDIADAYQRGDWHAAINAYWNPLYSWLLAASFKIFHPSPRWEFPFVHLVNFVIFLVALVCFGVFLNKLIERERLQRAGETVIPTSVWLSLGYTIFIVSSVEWITVELTTPDLCAAGIIYLAAALVLAIRTGKDAWRLRFFLGVCLGFLYLAKIATFLPVFISFVPASVGFRGGIRQVASRAAIILVGVGLVAAPFVIVLSKRQGHLTFSEAGKLNYALYVNGLSGHWFGEVPGYGKPVHPHAKVFDYPAAYAFDALAPGSYPGWYDPARWYEGIKPHFVLSRQLYVIRTNIQMFFDFLFSKFQTGLITGILILYFFAGNWRVAWRRLVAEWFLLLPMVVASCMYNLVWVEPRYLGGVAAVLWMGLLSGISSPVTAESQKRLRLVTAVMVLVTLVAVLESTVVRVYQDGTAPPKEWQFAEYLHRSGIRAGDRVAVIGFTQMCGWARLARVHITAEISRDGSHADFIAANDNLKARALGALFGTGVAAVIADHREESGCETGWRAAGRTGFYVCMAPPGG